MSTKHNTVALTCVLANMLTILIFRAKVVAAPCQALLSRVTCQVVCN